MFGIDIKRGKKYFYLIAILAVIIVGALAVNNVLTSCASDNKKESRFIKELVVNDSANSDNWTVETNLQNGNLMYGDRDCTLESIPDCLLGAHWVKTACQSKKFGKELGSFRAGKAISVFIAADTRVASSLTWLKEWKDTGVQIKNSTGIVFELYQRDYSETKTVVLGTNGTSSYSSMYSVFVVKKDTIDITEGTVSQTTIKPVTNPTVNPTKVPTVVPTTNPTVAPTTKQTVTPTKESSDSSNNSGYVDMSELTGWATVSGDGVNTTTGGGNATPQIVTTLDEFTKLAGDSEPRVIVIKGTITCGSYAVDIKSNKTIVGMDKNATIHGGVNLKNVSNIIVSNINFHGFWPESGPDDCISARGSHHIWFNHLNVWDAGDGNMDITMGSDYITVSWCKFWYTDTSHSHRLCSLVGSGTGHDDTDTGKLNATYHHNWFAENVDQRMPRILYGKGHVYNNYYTCSSNSYCVGVGCYASVLIEGNYFKNVKSPHTIMYTHALPAFITAKNNIYDNTTGDKVTGLGGGQFGNVDAFTNPPYKYTVDNAKDVPSIVMNNVGPQ